MDNPGYNNRFTCSSCMGESDWIRSNCASVLRYEDLYSASSGDYTRIKGWKELYQPSRQSVIAYAEMLGHLEAQQRDELSLDGVLAINREAARDINCIILLEGFAISQICPIILTMAEELIATLFQEAIQKTQHTNSMGRKLVFGNFSEQQAKLRAQIMHNELWPRAGIIQKLLSAGSVQAKSEKWLRELDERLQTLISVIEGR